MWGSLRLAPIMAYFYSSDLWWACRKGDINEAVRILSAQEIHPRWLSETDGTGLTPLHYACRSGNVRLVRILVGEYECDPKIEGGRSAWRHEKFTPLHEACRYKFPVIFLFKFCCYRPCLSGRALAVVSV